MTYGVRWIVANTPRYADVADEGTAKVLVAIIERAGFEADYFPIQPHTAAANQVLRYGGKKP